MTPTERARELQPRIREALDGLNQIFESQEDFRPRSSARVFRIMAAGDHGHLPSRVPWLRVHRRIQ